MPPTTQLQTEGLAEVTSTEQCARSPDFWYDEGTVVLRVETTLFRVHRGILSTHSEVFKDAFIMPAPLGIALYEGCQVVTLTCDSVQDWKVMLTFIYRPLKVHPIQKDLPVDSLFSLMRLAQKYMFDEVFDTCLARLLSEFPVTLAAFDNAHALRLVADTDHLPPYTRDAATLISVINQAVALDIQCVLPCAYYLMMTRFELKNITKGAVLPDRRRVMLTETTKISILTGMAKLYPLLVDRFNRFYGLERGPWTPHCAEEAMLDDGKEPWTDCKAKVPLVQRRLHLFCAIPRFALASCVEGECYSNLFRSLCEFCQEVEMEQLQEDRERFWQDLPAFFDVGRAWVDLKHHPASASIS